MKKYAISLLVLALFLIPLFSFAQSNTAGSYTTTTSTTCLSLTYSLYLGSRDAYTKGEVTKLQSFLNSQKYLNSSPTGYFGTATREAVIKFQTANGISPASGYVGSITRAKIKEIACGTTTTTTVSACYYAPYDLDGSGKIDEGDKKVVSDVYLGSTTCPSGKTCDINRDGSVNSGDTVAITNIANGDKTWCPNTGTPACYVKAYDYNNDGKLDSADATLLLDYSSLNYSAGYCPAGKICDINKGGSINSTDATALLGLISGSSTWCPDVGTPACYYSSYDYDDNSKIDSIDVQLLGNYLNTPCPSGKTCDINKNGVVTIADVTALGGLIGGNTQWCSTTTSVSIPSTPQIAARSYSFSCDLSGNVIGQAQVVWLALSTNDPNGVTYTLRDGDNIIYTGKETSYTFSVSQNSNHSYTIKASNSAGSSDYSSPLTHFIGSYSSTCTPPAAPVCSYSPYDYNNNGKLDSADAELLLSYSAIGSSCPSGKACDVNKNGVFNSTDVTALNSIINGTNVCPVEPTPACFFYAYDYDNSDKLDSNDIQLLGSYLNTSCPSTKICDINQNGAFTIADVTALGSIVGGNAQMCNLIPRASVNVNTEIANVLESIRLVLIELSKILQ